MECCNMQDFLALDTAGHAHHRGSAAHNMMMIARRPPYATHPPWFDTRVFYLRVTDLFLPVDNDDHPTAPPPDHLTVAYFPLAADAVVRINGSWRTSDSGDDCCVSARLRSDGGSDDATYVNTDSVRISGTVGFEVRDGDRLLLLSGVLEPASVQEEGEGGKGRRRRWGLRCQSHMTTPPSAVTGAKERRRRYPAGMENHRGGMTPTVDVYVAGSFAGQPLILTDTLRLFSSPRKNHNKVGMTTLLDTIPEYESTEKKNRKMMNKDTVLDALLQQQVPEHGHADKDNSFSTTDYYCPKSMYHLSEPADYMGTDDDGELSWFNAGVRVGVGISLGLCVGVGLGVGLLVTSYQTTARNLRRRFF